MFEQILKCENNFPNTEKLIHFIFNQKIFLKKVLNQKKNFLKIFFYKL